MPDINNVTDLTSLVDINQAFQPIKDALVTAGKIALIVLAVFIIFKLISIWRESRKYKRIKQTYNNTEKILEKLEQIEKKLNISDKKEKTAEKTKSKDKKKK